jgi:hypothetical protein
MRLTLELPPPWQVTEVDGQLSASLPGPAGAVLRVGPLRLAPDEPNEFLVERARADTPPGARLDVGPVESRETRDGWPYQLVHLGVIGPGEAREERLAALYRFLEHAALVVTRCAGPPPDGLIAVLESARPDWRGDPVALVDLWDLDAPAPPDAPAPAPPDAPAHEIVVDRFTHADLRIQAFEPLGEKGPVRTVLGFRAVDADGRPLPSEVVVETSEVARNAGTPYVLVVSGSSGHRVIGAAKELPDYADLRRTAERLFAEMAHDPSRG